MTNGAMRYKNSYGGYYGDAMGETAGWQGTDYQPHIWALEGNHYTEPQFVRGAAIMEVYGNYMSANIFDIRAQCSNSNYSNGYRVVLITN